MPLRPGRASPGHERVSAPEPPVNPWARLILSVAGGRSSGRRECAGTTPVPPAGFEPAHPAPEAGALSPELRGPQAESSNGPSRAFRAEIAGDHRYASHAMTHAPGSRVLVVDDDPVIVRLLEVNFRLEGFEVDTASRGDEALRQAAASHPDIVVLDVM